MWCPTSDSNRETPASKADGFANSPSRACVVDEQGVEPCTAGVLRGYSPTVYRSRTRPNLGRRPGIRTLNKRLLRTPCLPITPTARDYRYRNRKVVCAAGFEPATPRFQGANSDQTELRTVIVGRGSAGDFMMTNYTRE